MEIIYNNFEYNINLCSKGLSAFYECDICGERLRRICLEFVANNKEKSRYEILKELNKEHTCKEGK